MFSVLDLFAGAGGLSLGLKQAGFHCAGAVEIDRFASETYSANFPDAKLIRDDISQLSGSWFKHRFSGVDLLAGGPPCQGFSVAGPSQYGKVDQRNSLVLDMARVARVLKPRIVLVENVKGVLRGKLCDHRSVLGEYEQRMREAGYTTRVYVVQAAEFGVPQHRHRALIISARDARDLPHSISGSLSRQRSAWRTVSQALGDLPDLEPGEGSDDFVPYSRRARSQYQSLMRLGSPGIANHIAMKHTERVIRRFRAIAPGESMRHVSAEHGQRQRRSHEVDGRGRYKMNNTRLVAGDISIAVTGNFQTTHVHPRYDRGLTAREGARLQSFPDAFVFRGPRTLMSTKLLLREGRDQEVGLSQYKQIGNSVPPLVARVIGELLLQQMATSR